MPPCNRLTITALNPRFFQTRKTGGIQACSVILKFYDVLGKNLDKEQKAVGLMLVHQCSEGLWILFG
jgi:hypothetical protein